MKEIKSQYLIRWKRPCDDSWMYHIPRKRFKNEEKLKKHLKDHTETEGVEFEVVGKVNEDGTFDK